MKNGTKALTSENQKTDRLSVRSIARSLFAMVALGCVALIAGEAGARFDDWLFDGIPFFEHPAYEALYFRDESNLRHGRPDARWKQVRLNNLGMRGPDVSIEPRDGCRRIMFLGASETFGEPSVAGNEYPARVAQRASESECLEVLNTSFPGIAPQSLNMYYAARLYQFRPDTVYIYPSTHFYLSERLPRGEPKPIVPSGLPLHDIPEHADSRGLLQKSRLLERLRDSAETPEFLQRHVNRKRIAELLSSEPDPSVFATIPAERLELLAADMRALVDSIRGSGAEPVLMTHAVRATAPPRAEDKDDLAAMRVYVPRAPEQILAEFEYVAADVVRGIARDTNTRLVDVAREISGRRDLFIDLVHLAPRGHERVSSLIIEDLGLNAR